MYTIGKSQMCLEAFLPEPEPHTIFGPTVSSDRGKYNRLIKRNFPITLLIVPVSSLIPFLGWHMS